MCTVFCTKEKYENYWLAHTQNESTTADSSSSGRQSEEPFASFPKPDVCTFLAQAILAQAQGLHCFCVAGQFFCVLSFASQVRAPWKFRTDGCKSSEGPGRPRHVGPPRQRVQFSGHRPNPLLFNQFFHKTHAADRNRARFERQPPPELPGCRELSPVWDRTTPRSGRCWRRH